jgi:hypothetical protein
LHARSVDRISFFFPHFTARGLRGHDFSARAVRGDLISARPPRTPVLPIWAGHFLILRYK